MTKKICDIKELSNYLNVSVAFVRKQISARSIPYYKIGNRIMFDINEINEWIDERKHEVRKNILLM